MAAERLFAFYVSANSQVRRKPFAHEIPGLTGSQARPAARERALRTCSTAPLGEANPGSFDKTHHPRHERCYGVSCCLGLLPQLSWPALSHGCPVQVVAKESWSWRESHWAGGGGVRSLVSSFLCMRLARTSRTSSRKPRCSFEIFSSARSSR